MARYCTETRTDSEGNTYTVEVPYTYYICNVKLENFDMSHLPVYIMGEEQMSLYAVYMHTLGNRLTCSQTAPIPTLPPSRSRPITTFPRRLWRTPPLPQ